MAKILGGSIEVKPKCAMNWHELLYYMTSTSTIHYEILDHKWDSALLTLRFLPGNVAIEDIEKIDEYSRLRNSLIKEDEEESRTNLRALTGKLVPLMINEIVGCECEKT